MKVWLIAIVAVGFVAAEGCRRAAPPPTPPAPAAQAAGAASPASVEGFPDYPGASRISFSQRGPSKDYSRKVSARLVTTDPFPAVKAFYENVVASGGWSVVERKEEPDEASWKLVLGTAAAEVEVEAEAAGRVSIHIERKDR